MRTAKTSLEHWAVLATVVDEGGFQAAARKLHRSQSAVSYAIGRLQQQLGLALLEQQGRRAVLTDEGRHLLQRARNVLADLLVVEELAASLKLDWEPELRLVVDASFPRDLLLRIVSRLQARCPNTQMQLSDAVLSGAEESITERSADVVVTTRLPPGVLGEPLLEVEFIAVALPTHALLAQPQPLTASVLSRYTQAVVRDSGRAQPRDEGWLGARQRCTVSSVEASLALVRAGLAYAWLPAHLVREPLRTGALAELPLAFGGRRNLALSLVLVRPELAGPAARASLECFREAAAQWKAAGGTSG